MTVIAFKDGTMAADTLASIDGIHSQETKMQRVGECLVGMSGDVPSWQSIVEWFAYDQRSDRFKDYDFNLMIVTPNGRIFTADQRGILDEIPEKHWAIGCGAQAAICVMDCGHTAQEAVKAAMRRVEACGGKVQTLKL